MVYLPEHSHCDYCGDPIPFGERFCDDDCKELFIAQEKEEKRKDWFFYGCIAASLVAILAVGLILRFVR